MEHVSIHEVASNASTDGIDRRKLADPLNTSHLAINRYVLEPGERLSGLHAHMDQEEVFIVIEGEATFETLTPLRGADRANSEGRSPSNSWKSSISNGQGIKDSLRHASGQRGGETASEETVSPSPGPRADDETVSGGEVTVSEDEILRFAPGEFQSAKNDADERVVMFALGAPRDSEDVRIPLECPECNHDDRRVMIAEGREVLVCPICGVESDASCPECGQYEMRAILSESEGNAVGICRNCGVESTD